MSKLTLTGMTDKIKALEIQANTPVSPSQVEEFMKVLDKTDS